MDNPCRVLLIKPCFIHRWPYNTDVPLGLMYLSSYLKKHLNGTVDIRLVDLRLTRRPGKKISETLSAFQPDVIGISLLSPDRFFLDKWLPAIRKQAPRATIVIGGPGATHEYADLLPANKAVDCAVLGEGERTFCELVKALVERKPFRTLSGIAFHDGQKVVVNPLTPPIADLDTLPFPDYTLIDMEQYHRWSNFCMNAVRIKKRYTVIISSRGCPYNCIYCHKIFGRQVRKRSPENFVEEMRRLHDDYGIEEFHIVDDIFNLDGNRMRHIMKLIVDSGLKIKIAFPNGLRGDILTPEDILALKQAGVYMITLAVETASPRIQKIIRKNLNIQKVMDNIAYAGQLGIITKGFFMVGFPGETVQEIQSTISLAIESRLDFASFFIVTAFKNTPLDERAKRIYPELSTSGREVSSYFWDTYSFYQHQTGFNLKNTQRLAYLQFYLPFRIFRTFMKLPGKASLLSWPLAGSRILFPGEPVLFLKSLLSFKKSGRYEHGRRR